MTKVKETAERIVKDWTSNPDDSIRYNNAELIVAVEAALEERDERAAQIAVRVINDAREEGETDLRSVRERIDSAVRKDSDA